MTKAKDIKNCLERMCYVMEQEHLIIGTKDSDDYGANVIEFGHGNITAGI
ncbi:glycoside hydrolase [Coxiella-like endosymbiont]|nr:glycoside hydrolase [Coxiella-like endosymbiont]